MTSAKQEMMRDRERGGCQDQQKEQEEKRERCRVTDEGAWKRKLGRPRQTKMREKRGRENPRVN